MTAETAVTGISLPPGMTDEQKLAAYEEMVRKVAAYDELMAQNAANAKSIIPRYRVIVSLKTAGDRALFTSVSQSRAKKWIEDHCPRGQHFFLQTPGGEMWAYEHERNSGGPQGEDVETWQPFDREGYQAPSLEPVNTQDPWADAWEGAQ